MYNKHMNHFRKLQCKQKGFVNIILIAGIVVILGVIGFLVLSRQTPTPISVPKPGEIVVGWKEAISILNSGQVVGVMQTHSLNVRLTLKDGKVIQTKEPEIDAIQKEISKCVVCKNTITSYSTE